MDVILEISGRHQADIARTSIPPEGILLGRGWDCDIILRDPRIDAHHARLLVSETGELLLQDLNSVNGTRLGHQRLQDNQSSVRSSDIFVIGKTHIQVFTTDHPVPPARSPSTTEQLLDTFSHPAVVGGLTLLALACYLGFDYLGSTQNYKSQLWLNQTLEFGLGALLWMLFWGLISKLTRGESHFLAHWSLGVAFLGLTPLMDNLVGIIAFNLQSLWAYRVADAFATLVISVVCLVIALAFATQLARRTRWLLALVPAVLIIGITNLIPLLTETDANVAVPKTLRLSMPPAFRFVQGIAPEKFLVTADELFQKTSRIASDADGKTFRDQLPPTTQSDEVP